ADRHQVRLRARPVRRLHRAGRGAGRPFLRDDGALGGGSGRRHHRGARRARSPRSGAGRVHRRAGRAVRLLHRGHDHDGPRAALAHPAPDRAAGARSAGRQSLPLRQPCARHPRCPARGRDSGGALMLSRRAFLAAGGALVVVFRLPVGARAQSAPGTDRFVGKPLAPDLVDSYLAVHADGSLTIFVGKVDIGTGGRIAMRQIVAEELDVPPERIAMIEGDTALTPNQGATAGSYGIARGGTQLRQAAATARQALIAQAAQKLGKPPAELDVADGVVRAKDGSASIGYGDLVGDQRFNLKLDPKALVKSPDHFRFIGKSLRRPDIPSKMTDLHRYVHDLTLPGMLHARIVRPPALGATLVSVD